MPPKCCAGELFLTDIGTEMITRVLAEKSRTEQVLDALAERPAGRALDVPAGRSPVAAEARKLGWKVVELDLFPPEGFQGVQADACAPLPFTDESFDAVLSLEGIEHFENQAAFVRECARVLRPGGRFILTTPNVLHLSARFASFWTGQRGLKRGFINEDQTLRGRDGDRVYHGHAFLIDVFRLRYIMAIEGLRILGLRRGKVSIGSLLFAPLIPLVWMMTRLCLNAGHSTRSREGSTAASPETVADIRRLADSSTLMLSRSLIVTAEKVPGHLKGFSGKLDL